MDSARSVRRRLFLDSLTAGESVAAAARAAGVHRTKPYQWAARGDDAMAEALGVAGRPWSPVQEFMWPSDGQAWEAWSRAVRPGLSSRAQRAEADEWTKWSWRKQAVMKRQEQQRRARTGAAVPAAGAILQLVKDQGYQCALTGEALTPDAAAVDHDVPISRGGGHDARNLLVVTPAVNRAKGAMTAQEFIALCRAVSDWSRAQ